MTEKTASVSRTPREHKPYDAVFRRHQHKPVGRFIVVIN
jgi:hypothetical protein